MTNNRRLALIIANNQYENLTFAQLTAPVQDAEELARVFNDPSVGQFDDVKVLLNEHHSIIRRAIAEFFNQKKHDDMLVVYFSGHGVLDDQNRLFLAAKDSEPALHLLPVTAIPAQDICEQMDQCPSKRQVLILDCCYSGAFANGTKGGSTVPMPIDLEKSFAGNGQGRVILTASSATEVAWEGNQFIKDSVHSLFTHYLVDGLKSGSADLNEDGKITLDELYKYVCEEVVLQTTKQTPSKWSVQQQGEIVIAQSAKVRKKLAKATHLPDIGYFTGRQSDLARLEALLIEQKLVIIEGLAGIGKTSFALEYAYASLSTYEVIVWHEIEQQESVDAILLSIATQLSEQGHQEFLDAITDIQISPEQRVEVLLKFLNQVKALVVFDSYNNCLDKTHRVQTEYWTLIRHLYERNYCSRILLTSKVKPKVNPRLLGRFGVYDLRGLEKNDSNKLLLALCEQVNYRISKAETEQLCRLVEGHPFAIKIIVGLLHDGYPLERIQRELRQQVVTDYGDYLLNLLYQRLTRGAKRLLEACAAFRRSVSITGLEKVPAEVNCLEELLPLFLLEFEPTSRFYSMHAIVRDYAYAKLSKDKERHKKTHNAIAEYYEASARNPHRRPDFITVQSVLEAEYHYIQAGNPSAAGIVISTLAQEVRPVLDQLAQEEKETVDKFYRAVLAVSEKDAHMHYHFARYLERQRGNPMQIEFHYCEAAKLLPDKFWLQYKAIQFLLKQTKYEKAQSILLNAIEACGGLKCIPEQETTQTYRVYIQVLRAQNKLDEAVAIAKEGLQRVSQQDLGYLYLAYIQVLREQGKLDETVAIVKEGLRQVSQEGLSQLYLVYIQILCEQGKLDQAAAIAKEGLQRVSQEGLSQLYLAYIQILREQEKLDEAIAIVKEGLQQVLQQDLHHLYKAYIQILREQGKLEEAVAIAKEGLQRVSQQDLHHLYPAYIQILRKQERLDEVIAVIKEGLQRVHQQSLSYLYLVYIQILREQKRLDEALAAAREGLQRVPQQSLSHLYLAYIQILREQERLDEATVVAREGLQRVPQQGLSDLYPTYIQILRKQGQLDEAIMAIKEGLRQVPQQSLSHLYLAYIQILREQERLDEATVIAKEGLYQVPQQSLGHLYLAYIQILREQRRLDEASAAAREGLQRVTQKDLPHLYKVYIQILHEQGQLDEAIMAIKEGLQRVTRQGKRNVLQTGFASLYAEYADILHRQNRLDEAVHILYEGIQHVNPKEIAYLSIECSYILRMQGKFTQATELLQQVEKHLTQQQFLNFYSEYSQALYENSNFSESETVLLKGTQYILNQDPQNMYAQQSQSLLKQGVLTEAIKILAEGAYTNIQQKPLTQLYEEGEDELEDIDFIQEQELDPDTGNFLENLRKDEFD